MGLLFLVGIFGVLYLLVFRTSLENSLSEENILVKKLKKWLWFQKSYLAGFVLFLGNAILFTGTLGVLYGLSLFFIPYVHFIVMIAAVVSSIWFWVTMKKAWYGSKKERLVLAGIGSSFYFVLTILFIYMYTNIEPYYPGEDTFMRGLGLSLAIIVTTVACITCFGITGFSKYNNLKDNYKYNTTTEAKNSQ